MKNHKTSFKTGDEILVKSVWGNDYDYVEEGDVLLVLSTNKNGVNVKIDSNSEVEWFLAYSQIELVYSA